MFYFFYKKMCFYKKSFTLIEISIVLLVLSLLTTAVISGKNMIGNAKALRIVNEISNYRQAINHFYQTYGALPGDYNNAQYVLASSGYTKMSSSDISKLEKSIIDTIPLNGNSNGEVEGCFTGSSYLQYSEVYGLWSHLSASHLIDKVYSNTCYDISQGTRDKCSKAGYNLPIISDGYNNNSAFLFYSSTMTNQDYFLYGVIIDQIKKQHQAKSYGVLLLMDPTRKYPYKEASEIANYVPFGAGGGVTSEIMMKIDDKMDDGKPFTGLVFGVNGGNRDNNKDSDVRDGQCNTYTMANNDYINVENNKIIYTGKSNKSCVGIVLFNEFNS